MSNKYPKAFPSEDIDIEGTLLLQQKLRPFRFTFTGQWEYGIDFFAEIPWGGQMMGNLFAGQLKSHERKSINKDNTVSQYVEYKNWNYWQLLPLPFYLLVTDNSTKRVYWINVHQINIEIKDGQDGTTIIIPIENELSIKESLVEFIKDILKELKKIRTKISSFITITDKILTNISYLCPKCGHRLLIGLEIRMGTPSKRKCSRCGTEMKKVE